MPKLFDLSVYFVVDPSLCEGRPICGVVDAAITGGATMVQYRDKSGDCEVILKTAEQIKSVINGRVPLLINDHVDIAKDVDADGLHRGQGDISALTAREILGPDKIIGLTAFSEDHIAGVDADVVDYIGTGPFYETKTDKGKPVLGAKKFTELIAQSPVPVVGIGGITPGNAGAVIQASADGVAMMRSISAAADPEHAARQFVQNVAQARTRIRQAKLGQAS